LRGIEFGGKLCAYTHTHTHTRDAPVLTDPHTRTRDAPVLTDPPHPRATLPC